MRYPAVARISLIDGDSVTKQGHHVANVQSDKLNVHTLKPM